MYILTSNSNSMHPRQLKKLWKLCENTFLGSMVMKIFFEDHMRPRGSLKTLIKITWIDFISI